MTERQQACERGASQLIQAACQAILRRTTSKPYLIVLFGSEARGEATQDSDIDLLVVLERADPQTLREVRDAVYDVMWEDNFSRLISVLTLSRAEFDRLRSQHYGLAENIEREGITLWRAA